MPTKAELVRCFVNRGLAEKGSTLCVHCEADFGYDKMSGLLSEGVLNRLHPIVEFLRSTVALSSGNIELERTVIAHGAPYAGIHRPKGYRQMKQKACFGNAGILAIRGR